MTNDPEHNFSLTEMDRDCSRYTEPLYLGYPNF